jgi:hypothetical protein
MNRICTSGIAARRGFTTGVEELVVGSPDGSAACPGGVGDTRAVGSSADPPASQAVSAVTTTARTTPARPPDQAARRRLSTSLGCAPERFGC